ncbi:Auxin-responsive protein SAUR50, partial [Mucuna pruriens]
MAGAMKKVDKIRQIVRLKQLVTRWKHISLRRRSCALPSHSEDPCAVVTTAARRPPSGFIFVYVGPDRARFSIPARFLNLAVFDGLLKQTEEEFGLRGNGGLVLPCQVAFFSNVVKYLRKDEHKYGKLSLEDFVNMVDVASDSCKENVAVFTPLLQKAEISKFNFSFAGL